MAYLSHKLAGAQEPPSLCFASYAELRKVKEDFSAFQFFNISSFNLLQSRRLLWCRGVFWLLRSCVIEQAIANRSRITNCATAR